MTNENVAISRKKLDIEAPLVASEILDKCMYTGLFGSIDSMRMAEASEVILRRCESEKSEYMIIDLASVDAIDSAVAQNIVTLSQSLSLMGVSSIICGIRGDLARVLALTKVSFGNVRIFSNLKTSIVYVLDMQGKEITQKEKIARDL
jgi:anti-anti-sigma regulatory factor